jgi:linoleoyl-CoA desaturase
MSKIKPLYRYKIHDKLYDVTEFVKIHPGGTDMFNYLKSDTNITPMIYAYHKNPKSILEVLSKYEVPMTNIAIEYDTNYSYDKYCELKDLVYSHMHENKIPVYWSNKEIAYNAFMFCVYLGIWGYYFWNPNDLFMLILLGFCIIGFNAIVFHETAHYTGFKNQKINKMISSFIVSPFLSVDEWKERHNYLHHCFTNTEYDEDFDGSKFILRHSNNHILHTHHRLQYLYASLLFILNGYKRMIVFAEVKDYISVFASVFIYYWFGIINALILFGSIGLVSTFIANLSHIQYECIQINAEHKKDFLYNQVSSSMNYRTDDFMTRLISFGLDIQIEHHLFPNIPHSSLRKIQHIVRNYCNENNVPYIEKPNIFQSSCSYISYLYKMGQ